MSLQCLCGGFRRLLSVIFVLFIVLAAESDALAACSGCPAASFAAPRSFPVIGNGPVVTADFNGDGIADFLVGQTVLLSDGSGGVARSVPLPGFEDLVAGVAGDFDGDGVPDLALMLNAVSGNRIALLYGNGDGTFRTPVSYPLLGSVGAGLAAADFNGDGNLDLAVQGGGATGFGILLGDGYGGLLAPRPLVAGEDLGVFAVGDMNGDGKPDLIFSSRTDGFVVLLGRGDATFDSPIRFGQPLAVTSILLGDVDGDGRVDVVANAQFSEKIVLLRGLGDGRMELRQTIDYGTQPRAIALADFNGDGMSDLIVSNGDVFIAQAGRFGARTILDVPFGDRAVVTGDFDGDGRMDFAIARGSGLGEPWSQVLAIVLGNGDGTFRTMPAVPAGGTFPVSTVAADVNGDGNPDLIVGNLGDGYNFSELGAGVGSTMAVLLGNGDGTFQPPRVFLVGDYVWSVALADLNGDGRLDVLTTGYNVRAFLGNGDGTFRLASTTATKFRRASQPLIRDFNSDGKADVAFYDSGTVFLLPGNGDGTFGALITLPYNDFLVAAADFNGDGKSDIAAQGRIFLGNGDGTFRESYRFDSFTLRLLAAADIDGDSKPDLLVVNESGDVFFLRGVGDGTFGDAVKYASGVITRIFFPPFAARDFNGDGKPDLLALGESYAAVASLGAQPGIASFFSTAAGGRLGYGGDGQVAVGDFNRDGRLDAAIPNWGRGTVSILFNTNCQPRRITVLRQPGVIERPGQPFARQPIVSVTDDAGNAVACEGGTITAALALGTGDPGASLGGQTTSELSSGSAAFTDLSIDRSGRGYRLRFSHPNTASTSSRAFNVGPFAFAAVSGSATVCPGEPATLTATLQGTPPWNLVWSDGLRQNGVPSSTVTRTASPTTTTTYSLRAAFDAFSPASVSGTALVTARIQPTARVVGDADICAGGSAAVSAMLVGTPPWDVVWSDGLIQRGVASSLLTRTVSPLTTTTYKVTSVADAFCQGTGLGAATVRLSGAATPSVQGLTPGEGPETGGTVVDIAGSGFASGATVSFGGASAGSVEFVDSTHIRATTPAHAPGDIDVSVKNPPAGCVLAPQKFRFLAASRLLSTAISGSGREGAFFRTSVQLHNPRGEAISGRIVFHPQGTSATSSASLTYAIPPGATRSFSDVLAAMGASGIGSLDVVPASGLVPVTVARVFNDAGPMGTTGMTEDILSPGEALAQGEKSVLLTPLDPARARLNVGIRTLEKGAGIKFELLAKSGNVRASAQRDYPPTYFIQAAAEDILGLAILKDDAIRVTIVSGSAILYGVTADNTTQDPSLQIARRLSPSGTSLRILPVGISAPGAFGAFFRTSAQFHNPAGSPLFRGILSFYRAGVSDASGQAVLTLTASAGETTSIADALASLSPAVGSLDLTSSGSTPASLIRIYNDAGDAGTTGMTEEPIDPKDALTDGDAGILLAPPDPSAARFNIGVRTLKREVWMKARILDAEGTEVARLDRILPPSYFLQQSAEDFLGRAPGPNAAIRFEILTGDVIVYGATADNITQDPSLQIAKRIQ